MRLKIACLALVLSFAPVTSLAQQDIPISAFEGPPLSVSEMKAAIDYIEARVVMPEDAESKEKYGRYYAQEKGIVYSVYARLYPDRRWKPGVHIVANYADLPIILDGGCDFIDIIYVPSKRALGVDCHG
ncbi:hypothetical protein [Asticcacaulis sp. YBE204]|uniref:hypothetical protein n=1 Tax=Asticcacaulis sp. YBE204 TaxID=1282363 RepID=UPI0003C3BCD0|nr:hypothetical protein [Asticcacaulis sp. YBE204]ESQ78783.1 hypothetical protein AEYBE204_12430 [Asticcacaulis sp. YBE204]